MANRGPETTAGSLLDSDNFLRSINIVFDADQAERIAHYYPTEKSADLINKLIGNEDQRAFLVVAPYGSGKSMAGAYALHSIENTKESRPVLKELNERLSGVNANLGEQLTDRVRKYSQQGLTLALHGHSEHLVRDLLEAAISAFERLEISGPTLKALKDAAKEAEQIDIYDALQTLKSLAQKEKIDRILVLWDEFGRHLETLIAEGRASELLDIQTLAEFVSRQKSITTTMALFLHQGLLNYADNLPQTVRREWKKIEGRFLSIDYVEDSKEIYRLIGEIIASRTGADDKPETFVKEKAKQLITEGRFKGFKERELSKILHKACPLSPAALELLPRISARVSQNERTLFSFLYQVDLDHDDEVGADALFDYFSDQMQADVEVGGTHRQWLETRSALSKVTGDHYLEKALKIACLMGLGLAGERSKASYEQTILALAGYGDMEDAAATVDSLVERKLLLHRKHSNEVAIWHGTDLDLRGRLEEAKADRVNGFDLVSFLAKEVAAPVWKPLEYNADYSIRRYFTSEFIVISQFEDQFAQIQNSISNLEPGDDGRIFYVIPTSADERKRAKELIQSLWQEELFTDSLTNFERVVFCLPAEPIPILEAALEVACILDLRGDSDLTSEDPLVIPELQQMLDDARTHLQALIQRLTDAQSSDTDWVYQSESYQIDSPRKLSRFLSNISRAVYPHTPKIRSEVIVRKKASGPVVNSRKKLVLAMMERYGTENFEIQGNFPDASMFRTVLLETGLYRFDEKLQTWGFASPHALEDEGLRHLWQMVQDFFTDPTDTGRSPQELFDKLTATPFGIRPAMFPIIFAAGYKAFAFTTSLSIDGQYIADVLPSDIELLCREPKRHLLKVLELSDEQKTFVEFIRKTFSGQPTPGNDQDLIRNAHEAIQNWRFQLPPASLSSRSIAKAAIDFRKLITRAHDPAELLLNRIPGLLGVKKQQLNKKPVQQRLSQIKQEIEEVVNTYKKDARRAVSNALQTSTNETNLREAAQQWATAFEPMLPKKHEARPLLFRLTSDYESDDKLIESIAALPQVSRVSIARWEDADAKNFAVTFDNLVKKVESDIFRNGITEVSDSEQKAKIASVLSDRIDDYLDNLQQIMPKEDFENWLTEKLEKVTNKA